MQLLIAAFSAYLLALRPLFSVLTLASLSIYLSSGLNCPVVTLPNTQSDDWITDQEEMPGGLASHCMQIT